MITWVGTRLQGWAAWLLSNRGLGSKGLSANWQVVGASNLRQAFVPVHTLVHSRTHDWVCRLPKADQELLLVVYASAHAATAQAARLRISVRTLYSRLHRLHVAFAEHEDQRREAAKRLRAQPVNPENPRK